MNDLKGVASFLAGHGFEVTLLKGEGDNTGGFVVTAGPQPQSNFVYPNQCYDPYAILGQLYARGMLPHISALYNDGSIIQHGLPVQPVQETTVQPVQSVPVQSVPPVQSEQSVPSVPPVQPVPVQSVPVQPVPVQSVEPQTVQPVQKTPNGKNTWANIAVSRRTRGTANRDTTDEEIPPGHVSGPSLRRTGRTSIPVCHGTHTEADIKNGVWQCFDKDGDPIPGATNPFSGHAAHGNVAGSRPASSEFCRKRDGAGKQADSSIFGCNDPDCEMTHVPIFEPDKAKRTEMMRRFNKNKTGRSPTAVNDVGGNPDKLTIADFIPIDAITVEEEGEKATETATE